MMSAAGSRRRLLRLSAIFGMLLAVSGCSERREWAPVSGRVTLDGEPQEGIFIYFQPELSPGSDPLNAGSKSYGRTDADGRYTLNFMDMDKDRPGALIATHTVTADDERTFGGGGGAPDETGGVQPVRSRVPRGWTVKFVVPQDGTTEADFELNNR